MPVRRKHMIKQVDENTWNIRVNDHVLVEWETESDGDATSSTSYQVFVSVAMGEFVTDYFIVGNSDWKLAEWMMHDISVNFQNGSGKDLIMSDFDSVDEEVGNLPSLHTWLKMAHEKGAF